MRNVLSAARGQLLSAVLLVALVLVTLALSSGGAAARAATQAAHGSTAISAILTSGDIATGVRGTTNGNVILTGSATGQGSQTDPFLFQGRLTSAADGATVTVLTPPFAGETTATFYGPDTHWFNPKAIPAPVEQHHALRNLAGRRADQPGLHPGRRLLGPWLLAPRKPARVSHQLQRAHRGVWQAEVLQLRQHSPGSDALRRDHCGALRRLPSFPSTADRSAKHGGIRSTSRPVRCAPVAARS